MYLYKRKGRKIGKCKLCVKMNEQDCDGRVGEHSSMISKQKVLADCFLLFSFSFLLRGWNVLSGSNHPIL